MLLLQLLYVLALLVLVVPKVLLFLLNSLWQ
jgi:hypothetical protein